MPNWLTCPLLLVLGACQASGTTAQLSDGVAPQLVVTTLGDSLRDLRADFNRNRDCVRLIALLSPNCGPCAWGAQAVRGAVLAAFPDAPLRVSIVWIEMVPVDDGESIAEASSLFTDPRVRHYHDVERRAGRAFAEGLLPTSVAWDVYLLYEPGLLWIDRPPMPTYWSHQLGRIRTDHYHPGDQLPAKLSEGTGMLLAINGL
ncbi:MAG: hypothetical protein E2O39_12885 [Planctomycetota bacterium]|nr:MAG: hypothetical protein E2O39_12885 [Planctomycetota bacterium]